MLNAAEALNSVDSGLKSQYVIGSDKLVEVISCLFQQLWPLTPKANKKHFTPAKYTRACFDYYIKPERVTPSQNGTGR